MTVELWEMSDGRVWEVTRLSLGRVKVASLLDHGGLSRIGEFDSEAAVVLFAMKYLRLSVTEKVR